MADPKAEKPPTPEPSAAEKLGDEAAARAAELAARGALRAAEKAANAALDSVERLLFGKVGGAAEAVADLEAESALDRARRHYGVGPDAAAATPPAPAREDPVAAARRQLEELKRARGARPAPAGEPPAGEPPAPPPEPGSAAPEPPARKRTL